MYLAAAVVLISTVGLGHAWAGELPQETASGAATTPASARAQDTTMAAASKPASPAITVIPAGTKVALILKQAISTKTAKEGDAVYAETTFPVVFDSKMIIPAGTYVQGKISNVKRGGHVKGRAELLIHFTSMIYPNGYTVVLPGSLENVPGAEKSTVKDSEGTIRQDSQTGEKVGTIAKAAGTGAIIGAVADGGKGAGIGAGIGGVAGAAIAMLSRGSDVRLETGTSVEMIIQREVALDPSRIRMASN
jgi:hypothetical protein